MGFLIQLYSSLLRLHHHVVRMGGRLEVIHITAQGHHLGQRAHLQAPEAREFGGQMVSEESRHGRESAEK
jgi:hypothetical protein